MFQKPAHNCWDACNSQGPVVAKEYYFEERRWSEDATDCHLWVCSLDSTLFIHGQGKREGELSHLHVVLHLERSSRSSVSAETVLTAVKVPRCGKSEQHAPTPALSPAEVSRCFCDSVVLHSHKGSLPSAIVPSITCQVGQNLEAQLQLLL